MKRRYNESKTGHFIFVSAIILLGLVLCVFSSLIMTLSDKNEAKKQMIVVSKYVKDQCIRYEELRIEAIARSVYDVSDRAFSVRNEIDYTSENINEEIASLAERNRLSGIFITESVDGSSAGVVKYYYVKGDETEDTWTSYFETYGSVTGNMIKSYGEQILRNGYYYDYVIVSRGDGKGAVLCYKRRSVKEVEDERFSISTLLEGFVFGSGGVVAVTDGNTVLASNNPDDVGMPAQDCAVVRMLRKQNSDDVMRVDDDGIYYGVRTGVKDMFIYAYMPGSDVFVRRSIVLPYLLLLYLVAGGVVMMIRQIMLRGKRLAQERQEAAYLAEKEKLAQQAIKANEAKTDFLRRMSHDIRTPINGIRGMVQIGEYYYDDADKQKECRDKIWNMSEYLLDLVNNILDMNKLATTEPDWKDEIFDMTALLTEVDTFTGIQAKEAGITRITKEKTITHDHLFGGKVQLKRVITNIVVNAIKYNKPNGRVTVSCDEIACDDKNATYKFVCEDTGIGMSEEFLRKMYEPFERENRDAGKTLEGVGLGLAIVKKIVDRAGWKLTVDSKVGEGTVFTLVATFKIVEPPKKIETLPEPDESDRLKGYNILVAEDNELNYEIVEFMLKIAGANVIRATDGREATDIFEKSKVGEIDAVLMDVMMPEVDGLTAAREIRKLDRKDAGVVPIIAMTASAFADDVENARTAGMNAHIAKPIESEKLVNCIVRLIKKSGEG